jgi:hypothetical protein
LLPLATGKADTDGRRSAGAPLLTRGLPWQHLSMAEDEIEEGFFRKFEDEASSLPWPVPEPEWERRSEFLERLQVIEATSGHMDWMGYSICRLCGRSNGASDYKAGRWIWPEGYRHYISEHLIRPSADFEAFVLGKACSGS